jgi:hypothetical protein
MRNGKFALTGVLIVALAACACVPAVDGAVTESALDALHMAETETAMEPLHVTATESAMEAIHANETETAMAALHTAETETAMEALPADEAQAAAGGAPTMMVSGAFYNLQHVGRGEAVLAGSTDEGYVLKLQGFEVEPGPDLHIVLTSAETVAPDASTLPDVIDLGLLPAIRGDLEIPVPVGADVSTARSVVIWCQSFSVSFIAAPLAP